MMFGYLVQWFPLKPWCKSKTKTDIEMKFNQLNELY